MSNKAAKGNRAIWGGLVVVAFALSAFWVSYERSVEHRELTLAELDLRDGVLYLKDGDDVFSGSFVENYGPEFRKLEIAIVDGRADGISRGWYENGQIEVEEFFVNGVSNGLRSRWYENGSKKSEAPIEDGVISGLFRQWHENGNLAAVVAMQDGKNHGLAEAWYPSGALKSRVQFVDGVAGEKEFFSDDVSVARVDQP